MIIEADSTDFYMSLNFYFLSILVFYRSICLVFQVGYYGIWPSFEKQYINLLRRREDKMQTCYKCGGIGKILDPISAAFTPHYLTCDACNGKGQIPSDYIKCHKCCGMGSILSEHSGSTPHYRICDNCTGKGYLSAPLQMCFKCGGLGKLLDPVSAPLSPNYITCDACGGKGSISSAYQKCMKCGGMGSVLSGHGGITPYYKKCSGCSGKGFLK